MKFLYNYLKSMRLYYSFVTGISVFIGQILCFKNFELLVDNWKIIAILAIGFLAWGVNQIFNDFGNLKEDSVNAPNRPMVSGKLNIKGALILSIALSTIFVVVATIISPISLIPIFIGMLLNIAYNFTKKIPFIGCIIYGLSISMGMFFGFMAMSKSLPIIEVYKYALILTFIHSIMCYFSNFKDIAGDKLAGIITPQVWLGYKKSLQIGIVLEFILLIILNISLENKRWTGLIIVIILFSLLISLLTKKSLHLATAINCQLCVAHMLYLLCSFSNKMSSFWYLYLGVFVLIQLLFMWYSDAKE